MLKALKRRQWSGIAANMRVDRKENVYFGLLCVARAFLLKNRKKIRD